MLSEEQKLCVQILEATIGEEIDGIGEVFLDGELLNFSFQYGDFVFDAILNPEEGTLTY